jgi:hypothetical protein
MGKQPLKKKEVSSPKDKLAALKAFKEANGLGGVKEKELSWFIMPEAYQEATRLPGIPMGYVSAVRGHSNTGKSTIKLELIKAAQKQGVVPVVFELENNFSWTHAKDIGVNVSEYIDPETGEVEYGPGDDMLYYDTAKLYELYGTYDHSQSKYVSKPQRETYVIEDVALCIRELIRKQREGELPFDMLFIIDSIGVGDCYQAAVKNGSNNMWYAAACSSAFNVICNDLIPSSRNINSEYTNTLFIINKIWIATTSIGLPSAKSKGGNSLTYSYRLLIYVGGIESASVKALTAVSGGREYQYGVKTKIKIEKNHINNLTYSGEICSLQQGLWDPNKLDEYKKKYASFIKEKLAETNKISIDEIGEIEYDEVDKEE